MTDNYRLGSGSLGSYSQVAALDRAMKNEPTLNCRERNQQENVGWSFRARKLGEVPSLNANLSEQDWHGMTFNGSGVTRCPWLMDSGMLSWSRVISGGIPLMIIPVRGMVLMLIMVSAVLRPGAAGAETHALLIGVRSYSTSPLQGPKNDVEALHELLVGRWGVPEGNVTELVDEQADKSAVLAAIDAISGRTEAGDHVLIYFSGHGTSAYDPHLLPGVKKEIKQDSGALVAYRGPGDDFEQSLIIGSRDLRPRFDKLDRAGRHVLLVLDSCFSGLAYKGGGALERLMGVPVSRYSGAGAHSGRGGGRPRPPEDHFGLDVSLEFDVPYKNFVILTAAKKNESAVDISGDWLNVWPTIDGKAHGALTDTHRWRSTLTPPTTT